MEKIWFFNFVPVFLVHYFMACLVMALTNFTTDQSALLAFKAHITFDPHHVLTHNWSTVTSCCNWIGVTCGARHQRVKALNLPNMGLTGTIPPHLGNLSFLTVFNVENNRFHGHLPNELALLRRLEVIDLRLNYFSGEVPLWSGILPKLQSILLFNNNFSGSLPEDMCNGLPELQVLNLYQNQFYGQIPPNIYKCRQLQQLVLPLNKFSGSIPSEIGNLTTLKVLHLGANNLEGAIPQEMGNLFSLETLNIVDNSLTGLIPTAIFNISSLKLLKFAVNNLSGILPKDVCYRLPSIEELDLGGNQLSGPIPSSLWGCSKLMILSLHDNKFIGSIPKEIGNLTAIKELYLYVNSLTDTYQENMENLTTIKELYRSHKTHNKLKGEIPVEMGKLGNLEMLDLSSNSLSGPIPSRIFNISTMKGIVLNSNYLSGQLPSRIGLWLPNLEKLYLWGNNLSGAIPSSISNASKLIHIELSHNSFTGFIPNTLGNVRLLQWLAVNDNFLTMGSSTLGLTFLITSLTNCKYLRFLALSSNPLGGILPISIGNLSTSLQYLYAYNCEIKGSISGEIGNLSNLITLSLNNNELAGSIPTTIGNLLKLQGLYLGNNSLHGSIPSELCHLRSLVELFLNSNKHSGLIPACLGNFSSLQYLSFASNRLTSIIPTTLWSLTNMLGLNLSTNSLSGYLPSNVGNLKVVTIIDLSWNQLSGDIPSTIGGLPSLDSLSLENNRLQGPIPQSFGNLISLEFLDLSINNLSGVIPKSLETLLYLKYLNVSFNRLEGEIPNGGPFANFSAQSFLMNDALCSARRLQVPPCKTNIVKRSRTTILHLLNYIFPEIVFIVLVLAIIFMLIRCQRTNVRDLIQADLSPLAWRRISYQELQQATYGFSESNLIGNGSFGSVYKGTLSDGMNVAIKVYNLQLEGGFKSFEVESEVLRNIRHRNLLKIISSCANLDFKALILEYMPNGSLEKWLYSHNYYLDILQRLNIMIDVGSALEYLHHSCSSPIVHCDLKPSNILLHEDMVAHVGDFGIAKLLGEEESMKHTKTFATIGYMAPEYGSEGVVSTRGDVYSFGILLMETFTRKKPTDEMFVEEMSLKHWVRESLPHAVIEVVDVNLLGKEDIHFAAKMDCTSFILDLALECFAELPEERIDIKDVLAKINNIKSKFQMCIAGTRNIHDPQLLM